MFGHLAPSLFVPVSIQDKGRSRVGRAFGGAEGGEGRRKGAFRAVRARRVHEGHGSGSDLAARAAQEGPAPRAASARKASGPSWRWAGGGARHGWTAPECTLEVG